jgi:hypothetical protein
MKFNFENSPIRPYRPNFNNTDIGSCGFYLSFDSTLMEGKSDTALQPNYKARRTHRKSRNGCLRCKQERRKVGDQHPRKEKREREREREAEEGKRR